MVWLELGVDDPPDLGSGNVWNNLRSRISDHVAVGKHDIEILIRRKEMYMTLGEVAKRYETQESQNV